MTEDQLVEAVLAAPDDLAPWQVFADWLADRGDPRGELMQVHLASPVDRSRERR
jgi:uncharacterized protein (TIGR02996 family)